MSDEITFSISPQNLDYLIEMVEVLFQIHLSGEPEEWRINKFQEILLILKEAREQ